MFTGKKQNGQRGHRRWGEQGRAGEVMCVLNFFPGIPREPELK